MGKVRMGDEVSVIRRGYCPKPAIGKGCMGKTVKNPFESGERIGKEPR